MSEVHKLEALLKRIQDNRGKPRMPAPMLTERAPLNFLSEPPPPPPVQSHMQSSPPDEDDFDEPIITTDVIDPSRDLDIMEAVSDEFDGARTGETERVAAFDSSSPPAAITSRPAPPVAALASFMSEAPLPPAPLSDSPTSIAPSPREAAPRISSVPPACAPGMASFRPGSSVPVTSEISLPEIDLDDLEGDSEEVRTPERISLAAPRVPSTPIARTVQRAPKREAPKTFGQLISRALSMRPR